ncbi:TPA: hypothetical protein ACGUT0_001874 [Vibrio vulnificus]
MRLLAVLLLFFVPISFAVETLSFATYNSKFLSACMNKVRIINYQAVIEKLDDVDVVALQEVRDRYALERFFPKDKWTVIIDDNSTDDMNLAFAIKKGISYRLESGNVENADAVLDFAFDHLNKNFVDQRRLLKVVITHQNKDILVLNHHAKSRYNGRSVTDEQRIQAALDIVSYISTVGFEHVALLGDFNDTPDDASLNSLEIGMKASMAVENDIGTFLVNVTEPLVANDEVSFGLKSLAKTSTIIERVEPSIMGSRQQNIDNYDSDTAVTHAMYDQILISPKLLSLFQGKQHTTVFDFTDAVIGNDDTRASDHVPVILTLGIIQPKIPNLKIKALLPNPAGTDYGNETITIKNEGEDFSGDIIVQDLSLKNTVLNVSLNEGQSKTYFIKEGVSLNNSNEEIKILDRYERLLDKVFYLSSKEQTEIYF